MSVGNAILLGLVQGITEFLPVSSSGHLSILNNLFGLNTTEGGHLLFDVLLHFGTLFSIFVVYWKDIAAMVRETLGLLNLGPDAGTAPAHRPGARLFAMIVCGTLPLLLILPIKSMLESLFDRSIFIGVMLLLTGCMLYVGDRMQPGKKGVLGMTIFDALIIGLCQCVAVIPGLSRAGTTITAGLATGLRRDFAVRFSFLLSIPAVLGANLLSLFDAFREGVDLSAFPVYLIGMSVAAVAGILSIELLQVIARRGKFGGFAYYCWVAGVLSIILTMIF